MACNDSIVINASPLITLCKSQQEDLLPLLFTNIIIPAVVWHEVMIQQPPDRAALCLPNLAWLTRADVQPIPPIIQAWDLGAGETAVLAFALAHPDFVAVLDDRAARRCARSLQRQTVGTVGLLVLAKQRGLIPAVTPRLEQLQQAGLWLSDSLIESVKQQADE